MFDIAEAKSFKGIQHWVSEVRENAGSNFTFLLVGNKSDLFMERTVSQEEGEELACELGCKYIECSARTGANVVGVFKKAIKQMSEQDDLVSHYSNPFAPDSSVQAIDSRENKSINSVLVPPTPLTYRKLSYAPPPCKKKCC